MKGLSLFLITFDSCIQCFGEKTWMELRVLLYLPEGQQMYHQTHYLILGTSEK